MRDPKSEKTIKDVEADLDKMFSTIAQDKIGKFTNTLMIDNHLPTDSNERNKIIHSIIELLQKKIKEYRNKKLSDEGQERKRQLAIDNISKKVDRVFQMVMDNKSNTIYQLPTMLVIDKIPFDEIIVSSIIKEKLGF